MQRVGRGGHVFFRANTWHHAFAHGGEPLRVLELFAPPPAAGASGAHARTRPYLETSRYADDAVLGTLAVGRAAPGTLRVVRDADVVYRLEGDALVGLLASHGAPDGGHADAAARRRRAVHAHGGDEVLYGARGTLHVRAWHGDAAHVFELEADDAAFVPAGDRHEYRNTGSAPVEALVGVAPSYAASDAPRRSSASTSAAPRSPPAWSTSRTAGSSSDAGAARPSAGREAAPRRRVLAPRRARWPTSGGGGEWHLGRRRGRRLRARRSAGAGAQRADDRLARRRPPRAGTCAGPRGVRRPRRGARRGALRRRRGVEDFLYVTVGTGISLCAVLGGRAVAGTRGNAIVLGAPAVEDVVWRSRWRRARAGRVPRTCSRTRPRRHWWPTARGGSGRRSRRSSTRSTRRWW